MGSSVQARTIDKVERAFHAAVHADPGARQRALDDDRLGSARGGIVGDVGIGYAVAGSARAPDLDEFSGQAVEPQQDEGAAVKLDRADVAGRERSCRPFAGS